MAPYGAFFERLVTPEQPIRAPSTCEGAVSSDLSTGAVFSKAWSSRFRLNNLELSEEDTIIYIYIYIQKSAFV